MLCTEGSVNPEGVYTTADYFIAILRLCRCIPGCSNDCKILCRYSQKIFFMPKQMWLHNESTPTLTRAWCTVNRHTGTRLDISPAQPSNSSSVGTTCQANSNPAGVQLRILARILCSTLFRDPSLEPSSSSPTLTMH